MQTLIKNGFPGPWVCTLASLTTFRIPKLEFIQQKRKRKRKRRPEQEHDKTNNFESQYKSMPNMVVDSFASPVSSKHLFLSQEYMWHFKGPAKNATNKVIKQWHMSNAWSACCLCRHHYPCSWNIVHSSSTSQTLDFWKLPPALFVHMNEFMILPSTKITKMLPKINS